MLVLCDIIQKHINTNNTSLNNVKQVRRKQMRHVLFTEPEVVQAGKPVTIHYNPDNTSLAGRDRVWLSGSYNRWKHPKTYGPVELAPPEQGQHFSVCCCFVVVFGCFCSYCLVFGEFCIECAKV